MIATLEMFHNPSLFADQDGLRSMVYDRAEPISLVPGLESKIWFFNEELGAFGAFLLWRSDEALAAFRESEDISAIAERWGCEPQIQDFRVIQSVTDGVVNRP